MTNWTLLPGHDCRLVGGTPRCLAEAPAYVLYLTNASYSRRNNFLLLLLRERLYMNTMARAGLMHNHGISQQPDKIAPATISQVNERAS
jgi:hypothetical protein